MAATSIPDVFRDVKFKFPFDEDLVRMVAHNYADNGRLRIDLVTCGECPEPFATLTMNLPEDDPGEDGFFVKLYSDNEPLAEVLLASGVFVPTKHPREVTWKFTKGRTIKFENGEAFEDQVVHVQSGASSIEAGVKARYVPLGEMAWAIHQPGLPRGERCLGRRLQEAPICPYCGAASEFVGGDAIYPHRPDLAEKKFWRCAPCEAYVGCHKGTPEPLGSLANAELRKVRTQAHAAFDPLWDMQLTEVGPVMKRKEAYAWLARELGIPVEECHIGMFNVELCQRTINAVAARAK